MSTQNTTVTVFSEEELSRFLRTVGELRPDGAKNTTLDISNLSEEALEKLPANIPFNLHTNQESLKLPDHILTLQGLTGFCVTSADLGCVISMKGDLILPRTKELKADILEIVGGEMAIGETGNDRALCNLRKIMGPFSSSGRGKIVLPELKEANTLVLFQNTVELPKLHVATSLKADCATSLIADNLVAVDAGFTPQEDLDLSSPYRPGYLVQTALASYRTNGKTPPFADYNLSANALASVSLPKLTFVSNGISLDSATSILLESLDSVPLFSARKCVALAVPQVKLIGHPDFRYRTGLIAPDLPALEAKKLEFLAPSYFSSSIKLTTPLLKDVRPHALKQGGVYYASFDSNRSVKAESPFKTEGRFKPSDMVHKDKLKRFISAGAKAFSVGFAFMAYSIGAMQALPALFFTVLGLMLGEEIKKIGGEIKTKQPLSVIMGAFVGFSGGCAAAISTQLERIPHPQIQQSQGTVSASRQQAPTRRFGAATAPIRKPTEGFQNALYVVEPRAGTPSQPISIKM